MPSIRTATRRPARWPPPACAHSRAFLERLEPSPVAGADLAEEQRRHDPEHRIGAHPRSQAVLSSLKPCSGICPASAAMAHKAAVAKALVRPVIGRDQENDDPEGVRGYFGKAVSGPQRRIHEQGDGEKHKRSTSAETRRPRKARCVRDSSICDTPGCVIGLALASVADAASVIGRNLRAERRARLRPAKFVPIERTGRRECRPAAGALSSWRRFRSPCRTCPGEPA